MPTRALILCILALTLSSHAAAPSADELKAQADFKKDFASTEPTARREALKHLLKFKDPTTCQMLFIAATQDKDREVRFYAFQYLCRVPSRDGAVEHAVAQAFIAQPKTDQGIRVDMAGIIAKSKLEFKAETVGAIAEFIWLSMRYPESYTVDSTTNAEAAKAFAMNQRKHFESILKSLDKLCETNGIASSKAPAEIKKWYQDAQPLLIKADRDLLDKNKKEDAEKAKSK